MKYPFFSSKVLSLLKRQLFLLTLCILFLCMLTGCGKNEELENYKANMNQFFENIRIFDSSINAIQNPESDEAVAELLSLLDSMDVSFQQMASLEVPDCFPGVDELADDASMYMSEAVSYYHMAYEGGGFDASLEDVARQNYVFANKRLKYIVSILHGDIPDEIFTYEDNEDTNNDADNDVGNDEETPDE